MKKKKMLITLVYEKVYVQTVYANGDILPGCTSHIFAVNVQTMPSLTPKMAVSNQLDINMPVMLNGKERSEQQWRRCSSPPALDLSWLCPPVGPM
jgi:hypothetical protein